MSPDLLETIVSSGHVDPKQVSKRMLSGGLCLIAGAFALDEAIVGARPWRFNRDVLDQAREHGRALVELFKAIEFQPKLTAPTERKPEFERFMQVAMGTTKGNPWRAMG